MAAVFVAASMLVPLPGAMGAPEPVVVTDEWVPAQIQPTNIPLKWSRATLNDEVTLDEYGRRPVLDLGGKGEFESWVFMLACERPEQLDCIESFGVVDDSTGTFDGRPFLYARTHEVQRRPDFPDEAPYAYHFTVWEMPRVLTESRATHLRVDGTMNPRGGWALNMGLEVADNPLIPTTYPNLYGCRGYWNDPCERSPLMPRDIRLRMVLRTSWIDPAVVMARMAEPDLEVEDLGNGARRITITGRPMLLQSQSRLDIEADVAKWVTSNFDFSIRDPRTSAIGSAECYRKGALLFSFNGADGSVPQWVPQEGRLKLNVVAPHFWPDGKTEWRGYYETAIPQATARCLWGIDPRLTNALSVEVYDENGEEKAATTSIAFRDGEVRIRAYDFTYSEPTIAVKVTVRAGQRCVQAGAQVGSLFCTKKGKRLVWAKQRR